MFPTVVTKSTNPATVFVTNFTPGNWLFLVGIGASFTPWNDPSGAADAVTSDGVTVQVYQKQKSVLWLEYYVTNLMYGLFNKHSMFYVFEKITYMLRMKCFVV